MRASLRTTLAAALLACALAPAAARCTTADAWTGPDKTMHIGAGALIAQAVTLQTADPRFGMFMGILAGALKEGLDATGAGNCSAQDFAVTAAGAALGAYTGGWLVVHAQGRTVITWRTRF